MVQRLLLYFAFAVMAAQAVAWAGPEEEARQLKEEANKILQGGGSGVTMDPKLYAQCVVKLERAFDLLDKANKLESDLAVEVSNALYWARKFTTTTIIGEIQREQATVARASNEPPKPLDKKPEPPVKTPDKKPVVPAGDDDDDGPSFTKQKKAYEDAEGYAQKQVRDDYAVALNWFKVADQLAGTEFAVKALAQARAAQQRFAKKSGSIKEVPLADTPAMALVSDGDTYLSQGKYDEAIMRYRDSLKKEVSIVATRRVAHAYFSYAQKHKDKLMPQFEVAGKEYDRAKAAATKERHTLSGMRRIVNWNAPALVAASKKIRDLQSEAQDAVEAYSNAAGYFRSLLNMAPNKMDFDAAAHYALCFSVKRSDVYACADAKRLLLELLSNYKPTTDVERTLYEFCRSELVQLNNPKKK